MATIISTGFSLVANPSMPCATVVVQRIVEQTVTAVWVTC